VKYCNDRLFPTGIPVACVVGFHEGTQSTDSKVTEAKAAVAAGALELDAVLNRDDLKAGEFTKIFREFKALRDASPPPVELKLIMETSQLDESEIIMAALLAHHAGWDYIKTSTGFNGRGASVEDVRLMKACAVVLAQILGGKEMCVKASGGIRTWTDAVKMAEAGASRIGASAGVAIVEEGKRGAS